MKDQYLKGAAVVLEAVSDPRVHDAWDKPSVLEQQTVGSLASHLARGSWIVLDYLDAEVEGSAPDYDTAADYYTKISTALTDEDHAAIRERGASVAAAGPAAVQQQLSEALTALNERLPSEPTDRLMAVYGRGLMRLGDYLYTRIVEQVVHLDDLARSVGVEPWENPPDAAALVIACGAEIGRRRQGDTAMIRRLFRPEPGTGPSVL